MIVSLTEFDYEVELGCDCLSIFEAIFEVLLVVFPPNLFFLEAAGPVFFFSLASLSASNAYSMASFFAFTFLNLRQW